jgi:bifunctional DNA-binding transcriptional regulator/antitoxin component of YhaV-PrlF toxin-antitoxin module
MWHDRAVAFHGFVAVQGRGVVALPAELRRRLHLDESGAQVEITEREDGVLELRPALPIPADQRWFWEERWQQREMEVDEHVAAGRVTVHDDGDAFLDHLDHLDAQAQADVAASEL